MNIAKIIVCLITLSLVYALNAGQKSGNFSGYTVNCSGITTAKTAPKSHPYRIKLTARSKNCTNALSAEPITEVSEIVAPGGKFTVIGKSFVTPSEGDFSYTVTSTILDGATTEVLMGPNTILEITPSYVFTDDDGITWTIKYPKKGGPNVLNIKAKAKAIKIKQ